MPWGISASCPSRYASDFPSSHILVRVILSLKFLYAIYCKSWEVLDWKRKYHSASVCCLIFRPVLVLSFHSLSFPFLPSYFWYSCLVNSSEIEPVTYYWIHLCVIVHRSDLGTVGPAKSTRWWKRPLKQSWSCNDWLPSLPLSLPLPCKAFSFEKLRCGHRAYLSATSSNFLLTAELQHNYICKCSIFPPSYLVHVGEKDKVAEYHWGWCCWWEGAADGHRRREVCSAGQDSWGISELLWLKGNKKIPFLPTLNRSRLLDDLL